MYNLYGITEPNRSFEDILISTQRFSMENFLAAIKFKNCSEKDIAQMNLIVLDATRKLQTQMDYLTIFVKEFNKRLLTDYNDLYLKSQALLRRIKSGIKGYKDIYDKCRLRTKPHPYHPIYGYGYIATVSNSLLFTQHTQLDMYGAEDYPACALELFKNMENFFCLLNKAIKLCLDTLREEAIARKDSDYCYHLYKEAKKEIIQCLSGLEHVISQDVLSKQIENDPIFLLKEKCSNQAELAQNMFHNFTPNEAKPHFVYEILKEQDKLDMTLIEQQIFGDDVDKAHKVRDAIIHFDDLLPDGYNSKNIEGWLMALFYDAVKVSNINKTDFYNYFYQNYTEGGFAAHTLPGIDSMYKGCKSNLHKPDNKKNSFLDKVKMLDINSKETPKIQRFI